MEQSKVMEYESRKASSDVLKPHYIYIYNKDETHVLYDLVRTAQ